ncbi:integrase [Agrobacterium larrymoorei]|uniref:integrase n=1 Tax=Agrobacterium larrymoorei TaxID=160699 RepID=UPI0030C55575
MMGAPGLKRKRNQDGSFREYWQARSDLVKKGYKPSSVRLHYDESIDGRNMLAARCQVLQAEMLAWVSNEGRSKPDFDGTLVSLSRLFQTNDDSPFHGMKWNSQEHRLKSLTIVERTVGSRQVGKLLGPDFKRWHSSWSEPKTDGDKPRPWRAKHAMDAVRQLIAYGVTLGFEDCFRADTILSKIRFKIPPARTSVMTAEHVDAIRAAAHLHGYPSVALATTMQFALAMRQKDVVGEWEPNVSGDSGITFRDRRWVNGLLWSDVDDEMILRKRHTKTGFYVEHDLKLHPRVLEEFARVPEDKKIGPMIISEATGVPYKNRKFTERWRKVADKAGIPRNVWSMDARAGAITEAYDLGAMETDVMKSAGHKNRQTSARYNRGTIKQTSRVAKMRSEKQSENDA